MSERPKKLPGEGFLGWLGRQVGYVSKAVRQPVPRPEAAPEPHKSEGQTIYRERKVLEQPMPGRPEVKVRPLVACAVGP